jgi:hypothetical protein
MFLTYSKTSGRTKVMCRQNGLSSADRFPSLICKIGLTEYRAGKRLGLSLDVIVEDCEWEPCKLLKPKTGAICSVVVEYENRKIPNVPTELVRLRPRTPTASPLNRNRHPRMVLWNRSQVLDVTVQTAFRILSPIEVARYHALPKTGGGSGGRRHISRRVYHALNKKYCYIAETDVKRAMDSLLHSAVSAWPEN